MFVITEIKLEQRLRDKTAEQGQKYGLEDERQITDLRNHTPAGFTYKQRLSLILVPCLVAAIQSVARATEGKASFG